MSRRSRSRRSRITKKRCSSMRSRRWRKGHTTSRGTRVRGSCTRKPRRRSRGSRKNSRKNSRKKRSGSRVSRKSCASQGKQYVSGFRTSRGKYRKAMCRRMPSYGASVAAPAAPSVLAPRVAPQAPALILGKTVRPAPVGMRMVSKDLADRRANLRKYVPPVALLRNKTATPVRIEEVKTPLALPFRKSTAQRNQEAVDAEVNAAKLRTKSLTPKAGGAMRSWKHPAIARFYDEMRFLATILNQPSPPAHDVQDQSARTLVAFNDLYEKHPQATLDFLQLYEVEKALYEAASADAPQYVLDEYQIVSEQMLANVLPYFGSKEALSDFMEMFVQSNMENLMNRTVSASQTSKSPIRMRTPQVQASPKRIPTPPPIDILKDILIDTSGASGAPSKSQKQTGSQTQATATSSSNDALSKALDISKRINQASSSGGVSQKQAENLEEKREKTVDAIINATTQNQIAAKNAVTPSQVQKVTENAATIAEAKLILEDATGQPFEGVFDVDAEKGTYRMIDALKKNCNKPGQVWGKFTRNSDNLVYGGKNFTPSGLYKCYQKQ